MADLWIDAQTAETKHKWISAIRKAIKGEPIVESRRDKKDEMANTFSADPNTLEETPGITSQIAMLRAIDDEYSYSAPNDGDGFCDICSACTVM